jgi:hypothetical protein
VRGGVDPDRIGDALTQEFRREFIVFSAVKR